MNYFLSPQNSPKPKGHVIATRITSENPDEVGNNGLYVVICVVIVPSSLTALNKEIFIVFQILTGDSCVMLANSAIVFH